jgi:succinate dehydrogenase / fumarate reductase iron-sulfur subunit
MIKQMDDESFGHCTNTGACEATCPKKISTDYIEEMNREFIKASLK